MQTHGSTNKSPIKLSIQWKINNTVICLWMGKTYTVKTQSGDFKVTTPEIPLLSQQAITSKINQINMQMHGSTNKSPIKLSMQLKINNTVICLWMRKTYTAKSLPGDFKVITFEIPLLSQQVVTSKGILVPYTNLQLNHYPNI